MTPVEKISLVLTTAVTVATFIEKIFGVNFLGKKIYRGSGTLWKFIMRRAIFREDVKNQLTYIVGELKYNGGTTSKDMLKKLVISNEETKKTLAELVSGMNLTALRLDINDSASERLIFRMDSFGGCTFINDAFLKKFGYAWSDIENFNWENTVHEDDIEDVRERWERAIEMRSKYSCEQRMITPTGKTVRIKVTGHPITENGILKEYYGIIEEMIDEEK